MDKILNPEILNPSISPEKIAETFKTINFNGEAHRGFFSETYYCIGILNITNAKDSPMCLLSLVDRKNKTWHYERFCNLNSLNIESNEKLYEEILRSKKCYLYVLLKKELIVKGKEKPAAIVMSPKQEHWGYFSNRPRLSRKGLLLLRYYYARETTFSKQEKRQWIKQQRIAAVKKLFSPYPLFRRLLEPLLKPFTTCYRNAG